MKEICAVLIITLSTQGYWFGGREGTVSLHWPVKEENREAVLIWELLYGNIKIKTGRFAIEVGEKPIEIKIKTPEVRVRTSMRWECRLEEKKSGEVIAKGTASINLFPQDIITKLPRILEDRSIMVCDQVQDLAGFLGKNRVPFRTAHDISAFQTAQPDIILIGPDQIREGVFRQVPVISQVESGSRVLILAQHKTKTLAGYPLVYRTVPRRGFERRTHPLLKGFWTSDLLSLPAMGKDGCMGIRLPADEPVLKIAWWQPEIQTWLEPEIQSEIPGWYPVPVDAMIISKTIGKGRLVLCQIPLGPWKDDPRTQMFLGNALEYLSGTIEPTLRPSKREEALKRIKPAKKEKNLLPLPGDKP